MPLTPAARETFTRLFGAEPEPSPTDPELMETLQNQIFDEVFSAGVLTDVERELLTVTCLATMQTLPQLRAHVGAALRVGATPEQLRETVYQCQPYIGYPKTLNAVAVLNEVLTAHGVALPLAPAATVAYEKREKAGAAIQRPLYGDEVAEVFAGLPAPFDTQVPHMLTAVAFGEVETRGVLDIAFRELVSLVAIAALGAATQLRPHVAGAIRAGNSRQKVAAALVQALPYIGGPYALSGLVLVANYEEGASFEAYR
ncbi:MULTISPECIES: carboxymuconolactone decarboxylase family protein [Actinomyces]|uniref:Carboxymuconolactone decarboxylase family protein n=1 Tax=Actinomyces respiraculi TaxID=2744574 RepID=A0A7T0LK91_9ACTO|nr:MULTISPECIES: carboxymuconolactone decarboxylase family protein [Actinomyces]QPL04873.1 carboxymuconolactone decarboxylase family protein [Actinomyces respiraculi]